MKRTTARLPDGWTVVRDPRVLRLDGGSTLVGGSPPRVLHLSEAARRRLTTDRLVVGDATSAALARLLSDAGVAHPDPAAATPGAPTATDVIAVVPVKDRPAELDRLLTALTATAPGLGAVIVVDDGSADPAAVGWTARAHGARVVRHPVSRGPAAARNTGARTARETGARTAGEAGARTSAGSVLAFLDSDVVPEPGWLAPLLGHLADPAVALAAPRVVAWGDVTGVVARYERRRSSLDLGPRPAPVTARSRVAYVPSAAMLVRRDAFGAGGFAEDMPVAEDVDLVWRLAAAGWRLRYEPAARVAHEHRDSAGAWLARKAFYGTGAAPLAERHPRRVPPVALAPWTAVAIGLIAVQRRWSVATAGVVSVAATGRLARGLGRVRRPVATAAVLAGWGLGGAVWQAAGALTRHWWPAAVLGALVSRRARRALAVAAVAEGIADWLRHRPPGTGAVDALGHVLAHRADDLAYGAGLWWGAWRHRSAAALLPDLRGKGPDTDR